jgi:hypothetical protein
MKKSLMFLFFLASGTLIFAQNAITLDKAIKDTSAAFIASGVWEEDDTLGVLSVESDNETLSEYIIDHLIEDLTNARKFNVVSRIQKDSTVNPELIVISGKINLLNDVYEMTISGTTKENLNLFTYITYINRKDKTIAGLDVSWKNKLLYIGARGGGVVHFFNIKGTADPYSKGTVNPQFSFNAAAEITVQSKNWGWGTLSGQIEFLFTRSVMDWSYNNDWQTITANNMMVPFLIKPAFYPKTWYISPFVGGYLAVSFGGYKYFQEGASAISSKSGDVEFDPLFGLVFGAAIGRKVGHSIVFIDVRYLIDSNTKPGWMSGNYMIYQQKKGDVVYQQSKVIFSLGLKWGFIDWNKSGGKR